MKSPYVTTVATSAEAAARLEIDQTTVKRWYKLGLLQGKHAGGQAALWIEWTKEVEHRLCGQASFDPRMLSLKSLCKQQGKSCAPPGEFLDRPTLILEKHDDVTLV